MASATDSALPDDVEALKALVIAARTELRETVAKAEKAEAKAAQAITGL